MHYKSVPMHQKYLGSTAKEINNNVTCRYYWLNIILIYIFVIGILKEQLSGGMYSEHSTFNTWRIACHMIKFNFWHFAFWYNAQKSLKNVWTLCGIVTECRHHKSTTYIYIIKVCDLYKIPTHKSLNKPQL